MHVHGNQTKSRLDRIIWSRKSSLLLSPQPFPLRSTQTHTLTQTEPWNQETQWGFSVSLRFFFLHWERYQGQFHTSVQTQGPQFLSWHEHLRIELFTCWWAFDVSSFPRIINSAVRNVFKHGFGGTPACPVPIRGETWVSELLRGQPGQGHPDTGSGPCPRCCWAAQGVGTRLCTKCGRIDFRKETRNSISLGEKWGRVSLPHNHPKGSQWVLTASVRLLQSQT